MNCTHFHAYLFSGILWFKCVGGCDTIHIVSCQVLDRMTKHSTEKIISKLNSFNGDCIDFDLILLSDATQPMICSTLFFHSIKHYSYGVCGEIFNFSISHTFNGIFIFQRKTFHFLKFSISEIINFSNSLELNMCKFPMKNLNYKIFTVHSMSTIESLYSICLFVCKIVWNKLWCRWQKEKNLRPFSLDQ